MLQQVTGDILLSKAAAFAGQRRYGGRAGLGRAYGRGFEWPLRPGDLPWMLLGAHSARLDLGSRDLLLDEAPGLNRAWYADIIMTLTA